MTSTKKRSSRSSARWPVCLAWNLTACACLLPPGNHAQSIQLPPPLAPFDIETTNYSRREPEESVACLRRGIERAEVTLAHDERHGYLLALLRELKIPLASQSLVFSKTSLQRGHISSRNPRAIYFNDTVYVAWIPGAPVIEILSVDPKIGAVLYTLDQKAGPAPRLQRNDNCLECHISPRTLDVPGPLLRSFQTSLEGEVNLLSGGPVLSHRTPLAERWGGWYVTGAYDKVIHRGNRFTKPEGASLGPVADTTASSTGVQGEWDLSMYPRPSSDIVALMILEHQTHMENLLTRLRYEAEAALRQSGHVRALTNLSEAFLKYLLFADEAAIPGPIEGNREFSDWFEAQGPKDKQGRSLRQLDLRSRLFKFPCSYLIYSEAFEQLPYPMRQHLYHRLWAVLADKDQSEPYRKISSDTRRTILEILTETKKNLPAYWTL